MSVDPPFNQIITRPRCCDSFIAPLTTARPSHHSRMISFGIGIMERRRKQKRKAEAGEGAPGSESII
jgi:hypothetical protein